MINNFSKTKRRIKIAPRSRYYAIELMDKNRSKTPIMIVVDPSQTPQIVLSKNSVKNEISVIVVPELDLIDEKLCRTIFDTIDDSAIHLYELPLVGKERGTAQSSSRIVEVFKN